MSSSSDEASDAEEDSVHESDQTSPLRSVPRTEPATTEDTPVQITVQALAGANPSSSARYEEDSDASADDDRENRFQGPSSTWRDHTREERALTASLDQQRANDLGIHLYNTHALKARLRDPELAASSKSWQSKRSWMGRDEEDEVPRKNEVYGANPPVAADDGTYRKWTSWRPSADLEDEVQVLVLRKAKDRFQRQQWADHREEPAMAEIESEQESRGDFKASDSDASEKKPVLLPRIATEKPAFIVDDEEAGNIAKPMVRHILSKLDDLLAGMHTSRVGQRRERSGSRSRSGSRPRPSRSGSRSRSRPRSQAPARSSERGRSRVKPESSGSDMHSEDGESETSTRSKPRRASQQPRHELGQRDWSDVLGIASLAGWDQAVIDRAARRCASLFGESMNIRNMPETDAGQASDTVVEYRPNMVPDVASDIETGTESEESLGAQPDAIQRVYCAYEDCPRHHEGWLISNAWRWREHLRRVHKLSKEQIADVEEGIKDASSPSISNAPETDAIEEGSIDEAKDFEVMMGGVHVDGFMEPIPGTVHVRGPDVKPRSWNSTHSKEKMSRKRQKRDGDDDDDSNDRTAG
ncbi:hypothetical protein LTS10_012345 [Elasticomyces elasticus]|nr:hypothetical protein LTS10_012345 [Elasticomyces elasticus]